MGEVYQAHDTKLGRDVAIKVLPVAFVHDAERLARFQREARMLASLNHPNIATIFGLEQSDGMNYLVMELVPGHTLGERAGEEVHTLTMGELPLHTHSLRAASSPATTGTPDSTAYLARQASTYHAASSLVAMAPSAITTVGGSQPHLNMQPFLVLSFCIALQGIFPSQN